MLNFLQKIRPEWYLRLGLGLMYLYSGIDLVRHPTAWYWALPYWLRQYITAGVPLDMYLRIQGAIEILLALILLGWFLPRSLVRVAAVVAALEFAIILILAFLPFSEANFLITFRDIGLLGAALALLIILQKVYR